MHVVHVGRPGRSTELLILRAVDQAGRPELLIPAAAAVFVYCFLRPFIIDFLGDHSTTPRRSMSNSSVILLSFQQVSGSSSGIRALGNAYASFGGVDLNWKLGLYRSEILVG